MSLPRLYSRPRDRHGIFATTLYSFSGTHEDLRGHHCFGCLTLMNDDV